jgi:hypothetical protein
MVTEQTLQTGSLDLALDHFILGRLEITTRRVRNDHTYAGNHRSQIFFQVPSDS